MQTYYYWVLLLLSLPFKRQPNKIVKHTQTTRQQQPTNCLGVFDHFVGLALKVLNYNLNPFHNNDDADYELYWWNGWPVLFLKSK